MHANLLSNLNPAVFPVSTRQTFKTGLQILYQSSGLVEKIYPGLGVRLESQRLQHTKYQATLRIRYVSPSFVSTFRSLFWWEDVRIIRLVTGLTQPG